MILFWILATAMLVAALFFVIRPLLRKDLGITGDREQQNINIAKERMGELDLDLKNELITQQQYQQTRAEIEQALLNDLQASENLIERGQNVGYVPAIMVSLGVLLVTSLSYLYLGSLQGLDVVAARPSPEQTKPLSEQPAGSVGEMVQRLADRLQREPDDVKGWRLLARSYINLNRHAEAVAALRTARGLVGDDPDVLLELAGAIARNQGDDFAGQPAELVEIVTSKAPNHPRGLWMAGQIAADQGDFSTALRHWRRLEAIIPVESKASPVIKKAIAAAEQADSGNIPNEAETAAQTKAKSKSENMQPIAISVQVSLDPGLSAQVSQTDTVFVYAQALNGPPMPLAVSRKQVRDLPLNVVLDDSMAMMPAMTLSKFKQVRIAARISKSGNAIPQSGDYQARVAPVDVTTRDPVKLVILDKIP